MSLLPILRLQKLKGIPKLSHLPSRISVTNTYGHGTRNQVNHLILVNIFPFHITQGKLSYLGLNFNYLFRHSVSCG